MQFDITNFYTSITENLSMAANELAKTYCTIREEDIRIILQVSKPHLIPWWVVLDQYNIPKFSITMGEFDSEEACELAGILTL